VNNLLKEDYFAKIPEPLEKLMQELNAEVVAIIAYRIKEIGDISPAAAWKLKTASEYAVGDIKKIEKVISKITNESITEIEKIFKETAMENEDFSKFLAKAKGLEFVPLSEDEVVCEIVRSATRNMKNELLNMLRTKAFLQDGKPISIRQQYMKAVDKAIFSVESGVLDYNSAMRKTVRDIARSGIKTVNYESGYAMRLDSAVRMNTLDGLRQMNIDIRTRQGEMYGADGVEISAHANPAPDHQFINGQQFSDEEWESINANLSRHLGERNCMHTLFPIVLGISKPNYTQSELRQMSANANAKKTYAVNGTEHGVTGYEATQVQRKYERGIRRLKDQKNALKSAGDTFGVKMISKSIAEKSREYRSVSDQLGLSEKSNRTRVTS
jgi:hypothetical protein